jgi:hypothetical protein
VLIRRVDIREVVTTMPTFRRTWLAIVGGALLLAFSVSAAFGAPPTEDDGPRGRTISTFVHELIFGSEPTDEEQEEDADEELVDDEADEEVVDDEQEDTEDTSRQVPEEFATHGECVSEAAHDQEGFEESDAQNRGEWVSTHARYICWGLEPPDEGVEEADADATDAEGDDDSATAKEERKAAREAAKAERKAAKEAAMAERQAGKEAARAERHAAKAERKAGKGH